MNTRTTQSSLSSVVLSAALLTSGLALQGCQIAEVIVDKVNAESWTTAKQEASKMPADQAWQHLEAKAENSATMSAIATGLNIQSLDSSSVSERAMSDLRGGVNSRLSDDAVMSIAADLKSQSMGRLFVDRNPENEDMYALLMGNFVALDGGRGSHDLPLETLNAELQRLLANDPEFTKHVVVMPSSAQTADQLLAEAVGSDFERRFSKLNARAAVPEPSRVLAMSGKWTTSTAPGQTSELAQELKVIAYVTLENVQGRQFLTSQRFEKKFVYHPIYKWISDSRDQELRMAYASASAARN